MAREHRFNSAWVVKGFNEKVIINQRVECEEGSSYIESFGTGVFQAEEYKK